jgi:hypothetical protein
MQPGFLKKIDALLFSIGVTAFFVTKEKLLY